MSSQIFKKFSRKSLVTVGALTSFLSGFCLSQAQSQGTASAAGAGASSGGGSIVIKGHAQTLTQSVNNANVRIVGDANTITLKGTMKSLLIGGDENGVRAEKVKSIMTKGDGNLVKWKSGLKPGSAPNVNDVGDHNTIEKDDGGSLVPPKNAAMDPSNAAKTGQ